MGNLGAQKQNEMIHQSVQKRYYGDKTVRVRADLHHIIKIETAKNGGNVKFVIKKEGFVMLVFQMRNVVVLVYNYGHEMLNNLYL